PFFSSTYTPPSEPYTLSLHDALPIFADRVRVSEELAQEPAARDRKHDGIAREFPQAHPEHGRDPLLQALGGGQDADHLGAAGLRSEEHTSELQSRSDLVCRLLLEKKK